MERWDRSGNRDAITTCTFIQPLVFHPKESVFVERQICPSRGQRGGSLCSLGDGSQVRSPHQCILFSAVKVFWDRMGEDTTDPRN